MRLTKRQLKRIIREEKLRLIKENYGSDRDELDTLGSLAYRAAEELEANEAYQRILRNQIEVHPELAKAVEDVVFNLRRIDQLQKGLD